MKSIRFLLAPSALALAAVSSAQIVTARSSANGVGGGFQDFSGPSSASFSRTVNDDMATRTGFVDARMGVIHAYSSVQSTTAGRSVNNYHFGTGEWKDVVTIDAPGLTGQAGTFEFSFRVNGSLTATGKIDDNIQSSARAQATVGVNDDQKVVYWDDYKSLAGLESNRAGGFLNRSWTQTATFTYGTPFVLGFRLEASASTMSDRSVSTSTVDLGHTAYWEGIQGVSGPGGAVSGFTLISASGTNWVQPVPEPTTMAALGLGALGILKRRKKA